MESPPAAKAAVGLAHVLTNSYNKELEEARGQGTHFGWGGAVPLMASFPSRAVELLD